MTIMCEKFNYFFFYHCRSILIQKDSTSKFHFDNHIKMKAVYSLILNLLLNLKLKNVTSLKSATPGYDNLRSSILSLPFLCAPLHIYLICLYTKLFSLMSWKLPMGSRCLNAMIQNHLMIIDQYLCYGLCQRSLRKSCTIGCEAFWMIRELFFHINVDFVNLILHMWV